MVEGACFNGVHLPFPQHLGAQAVGDEMLERAIRKLLQPAYGQGLIAIKGTGRAGRKGLGLSVEAQRAQKPHGGGCGIRGREQLVHALAPAGRQGNRAVGMGAQQHAQRSQRLRGGQGQVILRDRRTGEPRHQPVTQLSQQ